jgi:hypothetical protein
MKLLMPLIAAVALAAAVSADFAAALTRIFIGY